MFNEKGTGVIGTAFGASAFLAFLLLATHTLLSLYASSVISSTAWDAARSIAQTGDPIVEESSKTQARQRLHGFKNVSITVNESADDVAVRVQADRPMFLPQSMANASGLGRIDKTIHARNETWQ